jgi:uncharacterized protein HemY
MNFLICVALVIFSIERGITVFLVSRNMYSTWKSNKKFEQSRQEFSKHVMDLVAAKAAESQDDLYN